MFFEKILAKEKNSFRLKHKEDLDFVITTSLIILLTITGVFMSHYKKNSFMSGIKEFHPIVISAIPSNMAVNVAHTKKIDNIFIENMNPSVFIFATPNKVKTNNNRIVIE